MGAWKGLWQRGVVVVRKVVLAVLLLCIVASPALAYTPERNLRTFWPTLVADLREFKVWIDNMDEFEWGFVVLAVWIIGVQGQEAAMRAMGRTAPGFGRVLRDAYRLVRFR